MEDADRLGDFGVPRYDPEQVREWLFNHRRAVIAVGITLVLILTVGTMALRPASAGAPVEQSLPRAVRPSVTAPVPVVVAHISGAVNAPAVFQLTPGSRVGDLVTAAGGFTVSADPDRVNLAALVRDGDQVHIPEVDEAGGESVGSTVSSLVDLNRAGAGELQALRGIGPTLANAIIEHRARYGPFGSVDALDAVSGIGPATIDRLREKATV